MIPNNTEIVKYNSAYGEIELSPQTVKQYLARGSATVTEQDIKMFIELCKYQRLNPFTNEVYLIKYQSNAPAQLVIGRDAFLRRAYENPDFLGFESGIVVQRGEQIIQKPGTCPYPNETVIGGWCRVKRMLNGHVVETFKEVNLKEFHKNQATWNTMPGLMIAKVAESQAFRAAFPTEFQGLYTQEELPPIPSKVIQNEADNDEDPPITQEQRQYLFAHAKELHGDDANDIVREVLSEFGYTSTNGLPSSLLQSVMEKIEAWEPPPVDEPGDLATQE